MHLQKDNSTAVMAMDRETRLILFKMLNSGVVTRVDGVISTGKEAVVLGGAAHVDADDLTSEVVPVAIKVRCAMLVHCAIDALHNVLMLECRSSRPHSPSSSSDSSFCTVRLASI